MAGSFLAGLLGRGRARRRSARGVPLPSCGETHWNEVLRSPSEIEQSIKRLGWRHPTPPKTWDLLKAALYVQARCPDRDAAILDAGCVASPILELLYGAGYRHLSGCDVGSGPLPDVPELEFTRCDLLHTPYPDASFDAIACLSVIEHGVSIDGFLEEARRLVRPGGCLAVSADYHEPKLSTNHVPRETTFGLPWTIFSRAEIETMIESARRHGFEPEDELRWSLDAPAIRWRDLRYTFVFVGFRSVM